MKSIVCIFAHPDDEAFGPGGTIALLAQKIPVYIICVTNGEAGKNSSSEDRELAQIRHEELLRSAKVLGVKKVYCLSYRDGSLSNNLYHKIAGEITTILKKLKPDTLLTFEPRGISGHLDHVAVSMITSYIFEHSADIRKLMYYCISEESRALQEPYFIYYPPGYAKDIIDETIDITNVWDKKIASMKEHKSQKHDADRIIRKLEKLPKEEYFIVEEKNDSR